MDIIRRVLHKRRSNYNIGKQNPPQPIEVAVERSVYQAETMNSRYNIKPPSANSSGLEHTRGNGRFARMLRSSSQMFEVISEQDYRKLPPPPPVRHAQSTSTMYSASSSQISATKAIKIHPRILVSRTEFPDANRSGDPASSDDSYTATTTRPSLSRRRTDGGNLSVKRQNRVSRARLGALLQDTCAGDIVDLFEEDGTIKSLAFRSSPYRTPLFAQTDGSLHSADPAHMSVNLSGLAPESGGNTLQYIQDGSSESATRERDLPSPDNQELGTVQPQLNLTEDAVNSPVASHEGPFHPLELEDVPELDVNNHRVPTPIPASEFFSFLRDKKPLPHRKAPPLNPCAVSDVGSPKLLDQKNTLAKTDQIADDYPQAIRENGTVRPTRHGENNYPTQHKSPEIRAARRSSPHRPLDRTIAYHSLRSASELSMELSPEAVLLMTEARMARRGSSRRDTQHVR